MKRLKLVFTVILAVVMAIIPVMQAAAAGKTQYISEIRIGYGEDGKAALEKEGFAVWTDLNANEGGNGSEVWLGYKTTENADEAITDISLMNMQGGYSFDAYTKEIENLNKRVSEQLASFKASIDEFRTNYHKNSAYALQAYELMNLLYDDESLDSTGNPKGLGDIFLDENTSDETLHRIFLEGNTEAIAAVETALATACIETGNDTVLTRLEDSEYPEALDSEKNSARTALKSAFSDFHSDALAAKAAWEKIEDFDGGAESFFAREDISEDEIFSYAALYSKYVFLDGTSFGNTGMSLLDFALLDETEENEDGEVLEDEYLEMLAQSMTDGQLGIVATVGIMTVLFNANAGQNADEAVDNYKESEAAAAATESVSVYCGVDRSLFEDIDSIALTSDALREKAAAEGNDFGKAYTGDTETFVLEVVGAAATVLGLVTMVAGITSIPEASVAVEAYKIHTFLYGAAEAKAIAASSAAVSSVSGIILTAVGVIAIIAGLVLIIFSVLQWVEKTKVPDTKYTQIPRVIVDKNEENDSFVPYYAAKLAGAAEDETDSTKLYGDLNGLNGIDQWLGLYYTKNTSVGSPVTAEMLISSDGVLSNSQAEKHTAVHMFGSNSAANLNQYNTKDGAKAIYIFLRTDNTAASQSGSVFTAGSVLTGIIAFIAGAGIAAAVTYLLTRNKKESTET